MLPGFVSAMLWNDAPGRTQVEVIDAFERAIRLAKEMAKEQP